MNGIIADMAHSFGARLQMDKIFSCANCEHVLKTIEESIITLSLPCIPTTNILTLQELLSNTFKLNPSEIHCS